MFNGIFSSLPYSEVGGGMVVTTMTYYDGSNHFEGITDLVNRRKSIEKYNLRKRE